MSNSGLDIRKRSIPRTAPAPQHIPREDHLVHHQHFSALPIVPLAIPKAKSAGHRYSTPILKRTALPQRFAMGIAVLATFVITFICTVATSEVMANMDNSVAAQPITDAQVRSDSSSATNASPSTGLSVTSSPDTLAFSPVVITDPTAIYLPEEKIDVPDPLTQRKAFLKTYLESKHSVLADHVDALSEQTQWKLIIAIANSESSYCKHNALNNCWGVGGAWDLKSYSNYDQAIADVNRLLEEKYVAAGLTSPDKIEQKWVGHPNQNWEDAANQVMDELKDVQ